MLMLAVALMMLLPGTAGVGVNQPDPIVSNRLSSTPSPDCPQATSYHAFDPDKPIKPHKLGQLPPANLYAAVLRHDGKCEVPMIIKYGVGG